MKTNVFFSSLIVKLIHLLIVLSLALTSAFSATGVKRAAAKAPEAEGSGMSLTGLFSQVVPAHHRQQAFREKVYRLLGIDPGQTGWQEAGPTLTDDGRVKLTPTSAYNLPPTPTPTETGTEAATPTETLTSTETSEPTLTLTVVPSGTATSTETPQGTPTAELTPPSPSEASPTRSPSPTPGEGSTPTPVITQTVPVTAGLDARIGITLTLAATPTLPAPGDILTLTWGSNSDRPVDGLELRLTLPEGFGPWGITDGTYDPVTRELRLPISLTSGSLSFVVMPGAGRQYTLTGELWLSGMLLSQRRITLTRREPFRLGIQGGRAWGFNRRVEVTFPDGALPEAVDVEVKPSVTQANPPSLGGSPFEIVALSQASGQEVTQFTRPITIEVSYDPAHIHGDESMLTLFYFDEAAQTWMPMTTRVDKTTHRLVVQSEHLTLFDYKAQNWEAARLPNLEAFQVSSFTGAATYSFPIQAPPGPAGLQPSLSLSYNSQTVDSGASRTQASWVGLGWSLGDNYIQRNQHGTPSYFGQGYERAPINDADYSDTSCHLGSSNDWCGSDGDDTFSLVVNGQSWTLLRLPDNDTNQDTIDYRTSEESFWRIRRYHAEGNVGGYNGDLSYWVVWDKTGNTYYFESRVNYPTNPVDCPIFMQTWRWSLTRTHNIFYPDSNQELTYTYFAEMAPNAKRAPGCIDQASMAVAVYPSTITYPNDRYKVIFVRETALRTDYDTAWESSDSTMLYQRSRLQEIQVWQNPSGNWSSGDERLIRKYVLAYSSQFAYTWPAGGNTFTLSSIIEYGLDGTNTLPATTFTYDHGRLRVGNNGYSGKMDFSYEASPWYDVSGGEETHSANFESLVFTGENYMDNFPAYTHEFDALRTYFTPGGGYAVTVEVMGYGGGSWAKVGIDDLVSKKYGQTITLTGNWQTLTSYIVISKDGTQARPLLYCDSCLVNLFKVELLTTRYRVTDRIAHDDGTTTGGSVHYAYRYDEPATNDAAHSALVAGVPEDQRYTPAYVEYRGNGMVKEKSSNGKVSTTFFYQDDNRNGDASVSLVSTEAFTQPFQTTAWSDYSSTWAYNTTQPTFERVTGDVAAKVTNANADWTVAFYRSAYTVTGGEAAILQFRLNTTTQSTILAVNTADNGYWRWGLKQVGTAFYVQKCTISTGCDDSSTGQVLLDNIQAGRWYVLVMIVDSTNDDHFLMWVWDRDNPSTTQAGRYEENLASWGGKNWRFMMKVKSGAAWLDEYSEGKLYSLSSTYYTSVDYTAGTRPLPKKEDGTAYLDVKRTWTYVTEQRSASFEGDATWNGTRTTSEYNTSEQGGAQYGNTTRVLEASWDAANSRWVDFRLTRTLYYPNASGVNLVGLPAIAKTYSCYNTDYNGACSTNYIEGHLTGSQWSLYDTHTSFDIAPTTGKLTGQRALLRCNGTCSTGTEYFSDASFVYDNYGNRTTTTVYTGEGTYSSFGLGTARSSYTCYGGGGTLNGNACAEDYYHTYALWERNTAPTPHYTQIVYNEEAMDPTTGATGYTLSVPVRLIDPNNVPTYARYDGFGRMTLIVRNGDDTANPTARMVYVDTANPFYTQAEQRLSGGTYFKIRKYYNGLGQLLQTQVVEAVVNGATKDILVDKWYNASGQVEKQSVPYVVDIGSFYHTRDTSKAYTQTLYDALGRTEYVYGTDNTSTHYVYKDLETEVTDARGYTTHTTTDVWGRTERVIPPTGASVYYTSYDTQGRLLQVVYGSDATTNLTYDIGGRKLTMSDPDLGSWSYTYDALSNLSTQYDARGCTITMSYDSLNRLTGKSYTGCAATTAPTYTYDSTAGGNKGIGRRTSMTDGSGSTAWTYDNRGRMTLESKVITGSGWFKTQWTYNSADLPATMIYPGDNNNGAGETVTFTYHPQMLLNTAIGSYTYVKGVNYDAAGRTDLLSLGLSGGNPQVNIDNVYYGWITQGGRLQYLKSGTPGTPTSLQYLTYTYDNDGNVLTILDTDNSSQKQCFQYDGLNRLTKGTTYTDSGQGCTTQLGNGNYDEAYTYNATTGNLYTKTGIGTYTYNATHKHAVASTTNGWTFSYDGNGNMTQRVVGSTYNYSYDAENRLTSVSGGTTASFVYDGDGVRVKGTAGGGPTAYVGNYFEWTGSTSTMMKYYYAGSTRVAMRTGSNAPLWLLGDHLGSTSRVANNNGTPYTNGLQLYKPWGEKRHPAGPSGLPTTYRFTGQRQEITLGGADGLYYYGARWYDSALGRFTSPDTIIPVASQGTQAWDRFSYANNNPVKYNDPSGHCIGPLLVICIAAADLLITAAPVIVATATAAIWLSSDSHYHEESVEEREAAVTATLAVGAIVYGLAASAAQTTNSYKNLPTISEGATGEDIANSSPGWTPQGSYYQPEGTDQWIPQISLTSPSGGEAIRMHAGDTRFQPSPDNWVVNTEVQVPEGTAGSYPFGDSYWSKYQDHTPINTSLEELQTIYPQLPPPETWPRQVIPGK